MKKKKKKKSYLENFHLSKDLISKQLLFDSIVKELGLTKTTIKRLNVGKTKLDKVLSKEKCMKTKLELVTRMK